MEKNYSKKENKYQPIFNKEIAMTLQTLTGQKPYIFKDLLHEGRCVWSFVNDEEFREVFSMVMTQYSKRNKK